MLIVDGSNYDYNTRQDNPKVYAWGWLSKELPETEVKWKDKKERGNFLSALSRFGNSGPRFRGTHTCDFPDCRENLGQGVKVIQYQGKFYQAPAQVAHYIKEHNYCPPRAVVEAVLNGDGYNKRFVR